MKRYKAMCSDLWPWYEQLFFDDADDDARLRAKKSFCDMVYKVIFDQFEDTGMMRAMLCWNSPDRGRAGMPDYKAYAQAVLRHCSYKSGIPAPNNCMITDRPHYEDFVLERDLVEGTAATYVRAVTEVLRSFSSCFCN